MAELAEDILKLMDEDGWTADEVADHLGVTRETVIRALSTVGEEFDE